MKKRTLALLLAAMILAAMLGGCSVYNDLMRTLYTALGGEMSEDEAPRAAENASEAAPIAPPGGFSLPISSEPEEAVSSVPEPPQPTVDLMLNEVLVALARNGVNGELKDLMGEGEGAESQIIYGGSPMVSYWDEAAQVYLSVGLDGEYEAMLDAWDRAERRDDYTMPAYNCFPDDFDIIALGLGGEGPFLDVMFIGEDERSIENIILCMGQNPSVEEVQPSLDEGMEGGWDIPVVIYSFDLDGVTLNITYSLDDAGKPLNTNLAREGYSF